MKLSKQQTDLKVLEYEGAQKIKKGKSLVI